METDLYSGMCLLLLRCVGWDGMGDGKQWDEEWHEVNGMQREETPS